MVQTLSISFVTLGQEPGEALFPLLTRLGPRYQIAYASVAENRIWNLPQELSWEEVQGRFHGVDDLVRSRRHLALRGLYRLKSDEEIGLWPSLYGNELDQGRMVRLDGPVDVSFTYNQMTQRLRDAMARTSDPLELGELGEQIQTDFEELFLRVCGVVGAGPPVDHAAMYREMGWVAGPECCMVFHRDPYDYVTDLEHFVRSHRRFLYVPEMTGLAPAPARDPDIIPDAWPPGDPRTQLQTLLVEQGAEITSRLRALPRPELLQRLMAICDDVDHVDDLACYEHHGTLAVCGVPRNDVWQFYDRLARLTVA